VSKGRLTHSLIHKCQKLLQVSYIPFWIAFYLFGFY